ncbi:MAG: glycosyltransferase family 2 protein [Lentisphaeria bacterium]|nr:glycosyltransferase family 2 protein [Lentisphaeria bacterium]
MCDKVQNSGSYKKYFNRDVFFFLLLLIGGGFSVTGLIRLDGESIYDLFPVWFGYIFIGSMIVSIGYFIFLALSALTYKVDKTVLEEAALPFCTVLVPAYNEGKHVADTLQSLLHVEYPAEKLEIIAINDGSKDDTLFWIRSVAEKSGGRVRYIDLEKNGGKKHALYIGMKQAKGDFIVTVDSDSLVKKDAVYKLMIPFRNEKTAAVAGNIRGKKEDTNFYMQMMDVLLIFGCEFLRGGQSVTGNVFCTPGALSAYRKKSILPLLDEWLSQQFLGVASTIGEDRAIATLLRREGYRIVHQKDALAETCLPGTYMGLVKMLIRWTRSDIRENFLMTGTVMKNLVSCSWQDISYFIHWISIFLNMFLPFVFLPAVVISLCITESTVYQLAVLFISVILWSLLPAIVYGKERGISKVVRAFIFGFFTLLFLSWMPVYSLFTMRNSKWLTREKKVV